MVVSPEFSSVLNVELLGPAAQRVHIEANCEQRAALADRFGVTSIESLAGDFIVERIGGGAVIRVRGKISAKLTQACVVSGAPITAEIEESVDERFAPDVEAADEVEFTMEDEDPPEPIVDNGIDLGEVAAQYLGVAIDPYPRLPGAEIPSEYRVEGEESADSGQNPFGVLRALKRDEE